MPTFIAYAWLVSVLVAVAIAGDRNLSVLNVFAPMPGRVGLLVALLFGGMVFGLGVWQLASDSVVLGQLPITWAALVALLYAWACLFRNLWPRSG